MVFGFVVVAGLMSFVWNKGLVGTKFGVDFGMLSI